MSRKLPKGWVRTRDEAGVGAAGTGFPPTTALHRQKSFRTERASGAKVLINQIFTARLKSCPDTKQNFQQPVKPCPLDALSKPQQSLRPLSGRGRHGEGGRVFGTALEGGESGVADGLAAAGGAGVVARTSNAWRGKLKLPPVSSMTLTWQM